MKRIVIALIGAAVFAVPVAAQPVPWDAQSFWHGAPDNPIQRLQILLDRVNHGASDGSLDPREADRARHEIDHLTNWIHEKHYQDGGRLTPDQHAEVQTRIDQISQQIRWSRRSGW